MARIDFKELGRISASIATLASCAEKLSTAGAAIYAFFVDEKGRRN